MAVSACPGCSGNILQRKHQKGIEVAQTPLSIVVLTDLDSGYHALYCDENLRLSEDTIYACDIAEVAKGNLITFQHVRVNIPDGVNKYPDRLADALLWTSDEK